MLQNMIENSMSKRANAAAALLGIPLGLAGIAGLAVGGAALGSYFSHNGINMADRVRARQQNNNPILGDDTVLNHPYATQIGADLSGGVLPIAPLLLRSHVHAAANLLAEKVRNSPNERVGFGASYAYENPYTGALLGNLPGLGVNQMVAGEALADQAIKEKGYVYDHPVLAAATRQFIPGATGAWHHAAGKIMAEKEKQRILARASLDKSAGW